MANDTIMKWGSPTTVISEGSSIANGDISTNTTQLDNSTSLYPYARAVLTTGSFASAPDDKSTVNLYMVQDDVDGTTDESALPGGVDVESATFVGAFVIYNDTGVQTKAINITLQGVQKARYFIENKTGQALAATTTVKITPFTYTPST